MQDTRRHLLNSLKIRSQCFFKPHHRVNNRILYLRPLRLFISVTANLNLVNDAAQSNSFLLIPLKWSAKLLLDIRLVTFQLLKNCPVLDISILTAIYNQLRCSRMLLDRSYE